MVSISPTNAKAAPAPSFNSFAKLFQVPGFDKLPAFDAASVAQASSCPVSTSTQLSISSAATSKH